MGYFEAISETERRKWDAQNCLNEKKRETTKNVFRSLVTALVCGLGCYAFGNDAGSVLLWLFGVVGIIAVLACISFVAEYPKINKQIKALDEDLDVIEKEIAEDNARAKELQEKCDKIEQDHKLFLEEKYRYDHPKCPMCNSNNTRRISTVNRATSIALVGLASGKIGKQYECFNCRHKW